MFHMLCTFTVLSFLIEQLYDRTNIKEERKKFLKNCHLTSYAIIFGQRTFFSLIKIVFQEKHEFYSFNNNVIFKDHV